jgi:hypothetical protein
MGCDQVGSQRRRDWDSERTQGSPAKGVGTAAGEGGGPGRQRLQHFLFAPGRLKAAQRGEAFVELTRCRDLAA